MEATQRVDTPRVADERSMLTAWLDWHRATLRRKCAGLPDERLRERTVPPSSLSLLGLVRHMAEVERGWFRHGVAREEVGDIWCTEADPEADFDGVERADVAEAFGAWEDEVRRARDIVSGAPSLEETFSNRRGQPISLRWVLLHMIEEYARHNGHADLLRERIDGETGD